MKPIFVFFCFLSVFAAIQLSSVLSDAIDDEVNLVNIDSSPSLTNLSIPEDTLASSGDYWRKQTRCQNNDPKYAGFSTQGEKSFAVVRSRNQEKIYSVGDVLATSAKEQARIISLDDHTLVLRYPDRVSLLCRDNDASVGSRISHVPGSRKGVVQHTDVSSLPKLPASVEYRNRFGVMAPVVNETGKTTGYQLKKCLQYCWVMRRFGLQEGDVLTSVQGTSLDGISIEKILFPLTRSERDVELTLIRNGQTKSITLPWKRIAPLVKFINKG